MLIPDEMARAWAEISLSALVANAATVAGISGGLLPMVKANGYGLGAPMVARALEAVDPWGFGVATVEEGTSLRAAGILRPILVFSPAPPQPHITYVPGPGPCPDHQRPRGAGRLDRGQRSFHVESTPGCPDWVPLGRSIGLAESAPIRSRPEGVFTHFYAAESDSKSIDTQWERLQQVVASLSRKAILLHAANSAAALRGRAYAGDLVRPGIFLSGETQEARSRTRRQVSRSVVATRQIKAGDTVSYGGTWAAPAETLIATLGIGYADGVPRSSSNSGVVEVRGNLRRWSVV